MSKEHHFRIVSNLKEASDLVKGNVPVADEDIIHNGGNTKDDVKLIKTYDEWLLRFETPLYQDEVRSLVKQFKKEINTYDDIGEFQKFCYEQKKPVEVVSKIYFIQNNGEERE